MCIPVHSPWLAGYIDVEQTILVTLPVAGLFRTDLLSQANEISHLTTLSCLPTVDGNLENDAKSMGAA